MRNFYLRGTKGKIESRVVPERGYEFSTIWISGFSQGLRSENLLFPLKAAVSLIQSFFSLESFQPDVVCRYRRVCLRSGTGCGAAAGHPSVVHESNSYPGITTRILSSRVSKVFIAFDATRRKLNVRTILNLVGNADPRYSRQRFEGSRDCTISFGCRQDDSSVVGGSLGASSINHAVRSCARN